MKARLKKKIEAALKALIDSGEFDAVPGIEVQITRCKDKAHGDFATNLGMLLAKPLRRPPREIAEKIAALIAREAFIDNIEVAGPGFLNIRLSDAAKRDVLAQIMEQADAYGRCDLGAGLRVQIEFVSANPTGPLHVGHGRGAAYGAALADLLETAGYAVEREYYINDAGRQMDILAASVWLRYLELCGEDLPFPANAYKGDYVWDIAASLHRTHAEQYRKSPHEILTGMPPDESQGGDKEIYIDAMIAKTKALLGQDYRVVFAAGLDTIVADIRDDLQKFGVVFQRWYPESTLFESDRIPQSLERLKASGKVYEKDGATWFRSTDFGDEKDRVVLRDNGQPTYFASDIAYHLDKYQRGYDLMINIWGADHHGYVPRLKAAIAALGENPDKLDVLLVQFAILYRGNVRQQMSTRSGEFVTLRELRKEVGTDAARFFYVQRKCEQHLDFDLDLAKAQSTDNPVYYLQYAHARISNVFRKLDEQGGEAYNPDRGAAGLARLIEPKETQLMDELARYPEVVEAAARAREPHQIGNYLRELANAFHGYYDSHKMLLDDLDLRDARLNLARATQQVLKNGLRLLGVSAPERMTREA